MFTSSLYPSPLITFDPMNRLFVVATSALMTIITTVETTAGRKLVASLLRVARGPNQRFPLQVIQRAKILNSVNFRVLPLVQFFSDSQKQSDLEWNKILLTWRPGALRRQFHVDDRRIRQAAARSGYIPRGPVECCGGGVTHTEVDARLLLETSPRARTLSKAVDLKRIGSMPTFVRTCVNYFLGSSEIRIQFASELHSTRAVVRSWFSRKLSQNDNGGLDLVAALS